MKMPKVSLIFPCYNAEAVVIRRIRNIIKNTLYENYEIIAIDDGSVDNTYREIIQKFRNNKRVKVYSNKKNLGVAATKNVGIKKSSGKYVSFLETDMEVGKGWLKPLVETLESNNNLAGAQSKILDFRHRNLIQMCGLMFITHTFWVINRGLSQHKRMFVEKEITGIGTGGSTLRKSVLNKIGYYDEKTEYSQGDADSNWAIWMLGYKTITVPESIIYHVTGKSSKQSNVAGLKREFHFHKTPRVFLKNYEIKNILKYMPQLYLIYIARIVKNAYHGNFKPFIGMLMATVWNLVILPDTLRRRRYIQKIRKVSDKKIIDAICVRGNFIEIYKKQLRPILASYTSSDSSNALLMLSKIKFKNI